MLALDGLLASEKRNFGGQNVRGRIYVKPTCLFSI